MTGVFYVPLWQQGDGTDTKIRVRTESELGEENSHTTYAGVRTHDHWFMSRALYQLGYSEPAVVLLYLKFLL